MIKVRIVSVNLMEEGRTDWPLHTHVHAQAHTHIQREMHSTGQVFIAEDFP